MPQILPVQAWYVKYIVTVIKVNLAKIARGKKFTVELEMREISATGGATTPLEIKEDFGNANTVDVVETISFE